MTEPRCNAEFNTAEGDVYRCVLPLDHHDQDGEPTNHTDGEHAWSAVS